MNIEKHSKQREALRAFLTGNTSHPTAEEIYEGVKKLCPEISLATVYRNLGMLVENNEIRRLSTGDEKDHYDPDISNHAHFICTECGKIFDVPTDPDRLLKSLGSLPGRVTSQLLCLHGICRKCETKIVSVYKR